MNYKINGFYNPPVNSKENKKVISNEIFSINVVPSKDKKEEEIKPINLHNVFFLDRSYSMVNELKNLAKNVKETLKRINKRGNKDDLVTIISFSAPDEVEVLMQMSSVDTKQKLDLACTLVDNIIKPQSSTCFSKPLKKLKEILSLNELINNNYRFNVVFFTDGYTVTDWSREEERKMIFDTLNFCRNNFDILFFNTIGYGYYYDEDLLREMSSYSSLLGKFYHSKDINDFYKIFNDTISEVGEFNNDKLSIKLIAKENHNASPYEITYCGKRNVILFQDAESEKEFIIDIGKAKNTLCINFNNSDDYSFIEIKIIKGNNDFETMSYEIDRMKHFAKKMIKSSMYLYYYGYSAEKFYRNQKADVYKALTSLFDYTNYIKVFNALTIDDRQNVYNTLMECYRKPSSRPETLPNQEVIFNKIIFDKLLKEGKNYSVIDLFTELSSNKIDCNIIRVNPKNYNRIGSKFKESTEFYESKEPAKCNSNDIIINIDKMNVSLNFKINGAVLINEEDKNYISKYLNEDTYKTYRHKSYTYIKDGKLNINSLCIELSKKEYYRLKNDDTNSLISKDLYHLLFNKIQTKTIDIRRNNIGDIIAYYVIIDLNDLPIINKTEFIKEGKNLALDLDDLSNLQNLLLDEKVKQKVYNNLISLNKERFKKENETKEVGDYTIYSNNSFTDKEFEILDKYGINKNGEYVGKRANKDNVEKVIAKDSYTTRVISFGIKGRSTLGKVDFVVNKFLDRKKLSINDTAMIKAIYSVFSDNDYNEEIEKRDISIFDRLSNLTEEEYNKLLMLKSNNEKNIKYLSKQIFMRKLFVILNGLYWQGLEIDNKNNEVYHNEKGNFDFIINTKYETVVITEEI